MKRQNDRWTFFDFHKLSSPMSYTHLEKEFFYYIIITLFGEICYTVLLIFSNSVWVHINRREVYRIFTIRPSVHPDTPASPLRFAGGKAGLFLCTRAEWLKFVLIELQSYFVNVFRQFSHIWSKKCISDWLSIKLRVFWTQKAKWFFPIRRIKQKT